MLEDGSLAKNLTEYISSAYEENKRNNTNYEYFSLLLSESLLYNLYINFSLEGLNNHNGLDRNNMNNSLYSNSLLMCSTSQLSHGGFGHDNEASMTSFSKNEDWIGGDATEGIKIIEGLLKVLTGNEKLFKKLKAMAERKIRSGNTQDVNSPALKKGSFQKTSSNVHIEEPLKNTSQHTNSIQQKNLNTLYSNPSR